VKEAEVKVTRRDIQKGTGRNCLRCPIAEAIARVLPALGFENHYVWFEPYGGMCRDALGLEIRDMCDVTVATISEARLDYKLVKWAMNFDDWDDMRHEGWEAYEKRTGEYHPLRPEPFKFALRLSDFTINARVQDRLKA